ncbi:MAG: efflux RND transporter periplasmic adaptor subunit [Flavobacteriales bacterium]|nr:efflux RND transporter periplasmic adaptor subunit [Flavobacteriales bacterium]
MLIILTASSCSNDHTEGDGHDHSAETQTDEHDSHEGHDHGSQEEETDEEDSHEGHDHGSHGGEQGETDEHEEGIHLTNEQIKTVGIQFGGFTQVKINDYITATGTLGLPPNAYSGVSAKTAGIVKGNKKYVEGEYIKKGVVIAYIQNPDIILKQQEYLEASAELVYLKLDLQRQESLFAADAGVLKPLEKLKSEVAMKEAVVKGSAKYLNYLGIATKSLTPDNISQQIAIVAPISGYITSLNLHNGLYVEPKMELMEIVDESHLHLELDVFEKDIANIKEEQRISYTVPALGNTVYQGDVNVIGKEFDMANKTVRLHGHLDEERPKFIKDLYIIAKVWLNDETVDALPSNAVIKDGNDSYIYVTHADSEGDEVQFEKVRVIAGAENDGFTSVRAIDPIEEGMKIVVEGAYYVYAQSQAGELEHEH